MTGPPDIVVSSLVGYQTGKPIVQIEWGEMKGQLTADEARAHALRVLQSADAAESDLFIWEFATSTVGVTVEGATKLMAEFRRFREEHR